MDKLKVFEAFSGYGSQSIALRNLGIPYEVVAISEIDRYAIKAYKSIHGETLNLGDIKKINPIEVPKHDLFTYSFPCQDLSVAGKQKGMIRGETRSGLIYECERIIEYCKPKYLLLENVKNLVGKKYKPQFEEWLKYLENLGYTNYWKVLNAKDYGIPQNRERVFVVSILGEHKPYKFPEKIKLEKCIKDILENKVDEKYYLNKKINLANENKQKYDTSKVDKILCLCNVNPSGKGMNGNIFLTEGISPTLTTNKGEGYKIIELPCICASRGRNPQNPSSRISGLPTKQRLEVNKKRTSNTITTVQKDNWVIEESYKIRKLTPKECFRLMGMSDDDIEKIQNADISNSQQYKLAGNSIVINVLEAIFKELFSR